MVETGNFDRPTASNVPDEMKQLVRLVLRMFYSKEYQLVMDMLVHNNIMTEDDLCDRLLFERRQLRSILNNLRMDKFVSSRMQLHTLQQQQGQPSTAAALQETTPAASKAPGKSGDPAGAEKTARITYYYIDYMLFTNALKYRLDLMRKRLEAEQRDTTSRASFYCVQCGNSYTDLEINHLFDRNTGLLYCTYCKTEVQEREDQSDSHMTARARLSKFQSQVRDPIDGLLRKCDGIHLSSASLEPEVKPLLAREGEGVNASNSLLNRDNHQWSGEKRLGMSDRTDQITVTFNTAAEEALLNTQPIKERPTWLSESTVNIVRSETSASHTNPSALSAMVSAADSITQTLAPGRVPHSNLNLLSSTSNAAGSSVTAASGTAASSSGTLAATSTPSSEDIMSTLLAHERRNHQAKVPVGLGPRSGRHSASKSHKTNVKSADSSDDNDGSSSSDDDQGDGPSQAKRQHQESSSEEEDFYLTIQGQRVHYNDITPETIRTMTQQEKDLYIEMGRKIHAMME